MEEIPFFARQDRLTFARVGRIDPLSLADYEAHGGFVGLRRALGMDPAAIVAEVRESGLRGRGRRGLPHPASSGRRCAPHPALANTSSATPTRGDSGTFADRMLMEGDPFTLIEGMAIAGIAVGAEQGYVYIRSEYPDAIEVMQRAVDIARDAGVLGDVLGSGRRFDMEIRVGAGAYCLRRGNLASEFAGGQAWRGAGETAAARARGVPWPPDRWSTTSFRSPPCR